MLWPFKVPRAVALSFSNTLDCQWSGVESGLLYASVNCVWALRFDPNQSNVVRHVGEEGLEVILAVLAIEGMFQYTGDSDNPSYP